MHGEGLRAAAVAAAPEPSGGVQDGALGKPEVLQRAVHQRAVSRTHVREVSSRIAVGWWALLYVRPPAPHVRSRLVIPGGRRRLVFVFGVQIQMVG